MKRFIIPEATWAVSSFVWAVLPMRRGGEVIPAGQAAMAFDADSTTRPIEGLTRVVSGHREVAVNPGCHVQLGETPHTWVEWSSSQLLQNTPLHPIVEWGRVRFGSADAPDGQRVADLENTLRLVGLDAAKDAPLIALLTDVPLPEEVKAARATFGLTLVASSARVPDSRTPRAQCSP